MAGMDGKVLHVLYKGGAAGEELYEDFSDKAVPIVLGCGMLPEGLEEALADMSVGEERTVEIPCEKGFGPYDESRTYWCSRMQLQRGYSMKVGDLVPYSEGFDRLKPSWIAEATDDMLRIDRNHPLAGKDLEYWVKLVSMK